MLQDLDFAASLGFEMFTVKGYRLQGFGVLRG